MSEPRPISPPDEITQPFWDATRERKLLLQRCRSCGTVQHYPRGFCAWCGEGEPEWFEASGAGRVVSHTTVHRAPHPAFTVPYIVALVRLDEGPVVLTNILDEEVSCDQPVRLAWEELPDGRNLPVFAVEGERWTSS